MNIRETEIKRINTVLQTINQNNSTYKKDMIFLLGLVDELVEYLEICAPNILFAGGSQQLVDKIYKIIAKAKGEI